MNITDYIEQHTTPEDDILKQLRRRTNLTTVMPRQLSGPVQGKLLEFLSLMIKPKYILEIGTFTGYSAYCLSKGLTAGGKLHTFEIRDEFEEPIVNFFEQAKITDRVELHIGDAEQLVPNLPIVFDLAFIDGDKRQYPAYYNIVLPKIRVGGYIIVDNTLWYDKVATEIDSKDLYTQGVFQLNDIIQKDKTVENVLVPIRDGLTIVRKIE